MNAFVKPEDIIGQVELKKGQVVADFGSGAGFYSVAAARLVGDEGAVYSVDIMPDRLAVTQSSAAHAGLKNITVVQHDLEKPITGLDAATFDLVIISNILHQVSSREVVVRNAYSLLKTGGKLLVVEWKKGFSVFGPKASIRVGEHEARDLVHKLGFKPLRNLEAPGFHYAILFEK
jgi:ubiquinone/menaquinone biosynthesis C-methylase UbiE